MASVVSIEENIEIGDFVEFQCSSCGGKHFHVRGHAVLTGVEIKEIYCCACDTTVSTDDPGALLN
jgi:hypothetical protein